MITGKRSLREHFPHVDDTWATALMMGLRMRRVSGPRIGEILQEVDDHCAASGQDAQEAFGDPRGYAASLDFDGQLRAGPTLTRTDLATNTLQLYGVVLAVGGLAAWVRHEVLGVSAGALLAATLVGAVVLGVLRRPAWLDGPGWLRRWSLGWTSLAAGVTTLAWWGGPRLLSLPTTAAIVVGLALLVAPAFVAARRTRRADLIVAPGETVGAPDRRVVRAATVLTPFVLPVLVIGLMVTAWCTAR